MTAPIFIATLTSYTLVSGSGLLAALQAQANEFELKAQQLRARKQVQPLMTAAAATPGGAGSNSNASSPAAHGQRLPSPGLVNFLRVHLLLLLWWTAYWLQLLETSSNAVISTISDLLTLLRNRWLMWYHLHDCKLERVTSLTTKLRLLSTIIMMTLCDTRIMMMISNICLYRHGKKNEEKKLIDECTNEWNVIHAELHVDECVTCCWYSYL